LRRRAGPADIQRMAGRDAGGVSRRAFFTTGLSRALERAADVVSSRIAPRRYVRPPGALPEAAFVAACMRCGECVRVCPAGAILTLDAGAGLAGGTPVLDPSVTACVMCADMPCVAACPTDALTAPATGWAEARLAELTVDTDRCIAWRDVACGVCARACPVGEAAIRLDARGRPVIAGGCTGCGICISACVTSPSSIHATPFGGTA
jgi:ferredoxin-type protein NapG